jgi:beta-carotene ketolase (CrtW type)
VVSELNRQGQQGLALAGLIGSAWLLTLAFSLNLSLDQIPPLLLGAVVLVRAFLHTGLFIVAHDAMHNSLVPKQPGLNRLIGRVCLFLYAGLSYRLCCRNHRRHHQAPESDRDPDYQRSTNDGIFSWYVHFMGNYLSWKQLLNLSGCWFVLFNLTRHHQTDHGLPLLVFCVLPLIISSCQLFLVGTWMPHRRGVTSQPGITSRSLALNPVLSFAACYHFGYHREHHDSPSTPWFQLPLLRDHHRS